MACNVNMKSLGGEYVKTATIAKWYKKVGDKVNQGEAILSAETAKVTVDIVAPESGIIIKILYDEGDDVDINETIAIIDESSIISNKEQESNIVENYSEIIELQSESNKESKDRIMITPLARVLAAENNINISEIKNTVSVGRIKKQDVLNYIKENEKKLSHEQVNDKKLVNKIKLSGRRKGIAKKMTSSSTNIPHVTIMMDANIEKLKEIRSVINNSNPNEMKLSLTDFIIYLTVKALKRFPLMNSHFINDEIIMYSNINIGVAVDLEEGLLVPVIKNCDAKSIFDISLELKQLSEKAKNKTITPNEVTDGTFTITNLGMYNVEYFTPIINEPEVAILGVGAIKKDKEMLPLSLSFDHRVVDGAPAARFLNGLKEILENPYLVLFD